VKFEMILTTFSDDRKYRYTLLRMFDDLFTKRRVRYVNFIMLNPSTADEYTNDRTVAKCVKFAKSWGYDALYVTNLFAYRSTDPKALKRVQDPVGPENDYYIEEIARDASLIICAWSRYGDWFRRSAQVKRILADAELHYLKLTDVEPHHPLYLPDDSKPTLWQEANFGAVTTAT
jgi:hypothetical protein